MAIDWYFDYISPFAYLQFAAHPDLFQRSDVQLRPVLFAGFLNHWEHKGPAEIPPKKRHTFRLVSWQAKQRGIPLVCPPAHPFNPIHALRLTIALGATVPVVRTIFEFIWRDGRSISAEWSALCAELGVVDANRLTGDAKDALRENGVKAIARGVFGVPTFAVDDALFWGEDATGMLRDYLADPHLFDTPAMRRIDSLPVAAERNMNKESKR